MDETMKQLEEIVENLSNLITQTDDAAFEGFKDELENLLITAFSGPDSEALINQQVIELKAQQNEEAVEFAYNSARDYFYNIVLSLKAQTNNQFKLEFLDKIYSCIDRMLNEIIRRYREGKPLLKVQKLNENAVIPTYAHFGDQGADIYAAEEVIIAPHTYGNAVHTGIALNIPYGWAVGIRPRSGMSKKTTLRLSNSVGTIDTNYRGEIICLFDNIGEIPVEIHIGDRIAQMILEKNYQADFAETDDVNADGVTERGEGGFGSTGV